MNVNDDKSASSYYEDGTAQYFARRYHDAIESLNKAIQLEPRHFRAYDRRGSAYKSLKQYDHALCDYNRALEINPTFDNALRNRAHVFRHNNMLRSAIADFEAARRYCNSDRDRERLDKFIASVRDKLHESD